MAWLVASLRRLRQARFAFVGVAGLVLVTSFLAAAGPRVFERIARDSIQGALAEIPPSDRVIQLTRLDGGPNARAVATPVDLGGVAEDGEELRATFPSPLPSLLGPTSLVVETPSFRAVSGASLAAELRLRIMPGAQDHIRLVEGGAPGPAVGSAPDPLHSGSQSGGDPSTAEIVQLEAEISQPAATKLGLKVGSVVVMVSDVTLDAQSAGSAMAVKIVGIFEPLAQSDPFWLEDTRVLAYRLREYSANVSFVQSTLLLAPESFPPLVGSVESGGNGFLTWGPPPRRVTWRYPADPSRLDAGSLEASVAGLRRLETLYPNGDRPSAKGLGLDTRLLGRLVGLQGPWDAAGAVLGIAAMGAATVALAALGLVIALTAEERRRVLVLQRERGASTAQSLLAVLAESAIVAVPSALLGMALALIAVPGPDPTLAVATALGVAVATAAIELGLVARSIVGAPRPPGRMGAIVRSVRPRRLVFELLIVGLALVGAIALRDRGLGGRPPATVGGLGANPPLGPTGPDPFLTIVPVLVGVAAALVALRIAPVPIAAIAALAARGRGLSAVLAARRAARGPGASRVLLIVLAIVTLGAFASATILHLARTADLQAWQTVGAAVRIDAGPDRLSGAWVLPDDFEPATLPGVEAAAVAHVQEVGLSSGGQRNLVAIDAAALVQVLAGSPLVDGLPAPLRAPPGSEAGDGTDAAPLPAAISTRGSGPYRLAVGDTFRIPLSSEPVSFRVVAAIDRFPGIAETASFVVVSWPQIQSVAPLRVQGVTSVYLRTAPGTPVDAIAAAAQRAMPTAVVSAEELDEARLAQQPVVSVLTGGVVALAVVALLYATLAVVAAFVLAASSRALETAQLSTLGLGSGAAGAMLILEYGPPVVLATIAGAALGLGLFAFLAPGLGFATIVGALQTAPAGLDPVQIGLLAAIVAAILCVGVALGAPAQRRAAGAVARRGLA